MGHDRASGSVLGVSALNPKAVEFDVFDGLARTSHSTRIL